MSKFTRLGLTTADITWMIKDERYLEGSKRKEVKASAKSRKLKKKVWLLYLVTFALIGGIVTLLISNAQSSVVKNLKVTGTTPTTVSLSWDQSPAAQTGYKIYRNGSFLVNTPSTSYTDTGLTEHATYRYAISAYGSSGETTQSQPVTAVPTDNPPTVSILAPTANADVSGTVTITANAADDVSVSNVQFQIDGANIGGPVSNAPYSASLDTHGYTAGKHQLTAIVTDSANHKVTSTKVPVTVDNTKPTVSFQSPAANAAITGSSVAVQANATDATGVAGVTFKIDGQAIGSEVTAKPYKTTLDTSKYSNGTHTLTATARDNAGNTNDATITVTITGSTVTDTTSPTVKLTNPKANQGLTGTVVLNATASDNVGVSKVVFTASSPDVTTPISIGTSTSAPYTVNWDTTKVTDSDKWQITATASDAAGNTASDNVMVNVENSSGAGNNAAPSVAITSPKNNAKVKGQVKLEAKASDDVAVLGVQFKIDGNDVGTEATQLPYEATYDVSSLPNGDHALTAVARDGDGHATTSSPVTLKVSNDPDKTGPTIKNLVPANGSYIKGGSVTVSADVTDNSGVGSVQFQIDKANLGPQMTTPPFTTNWQASDGKHTISINTVDKAGNKSTQSASFTVDNTPPTVAFTAPGANSTVNGNSVKLSVNAADNDKVASVEYRWLDANQADLGQIKMLTKAPYNASWDTTTKPNAAYNIKAIVTDAAGNTATSTVAVTVNNTAIQTDKLPPSTPTGLTGIGAGNSVRLSWQASTDEQGGSGVGGYIVFRDGKEIAHVATPSYVDNKVVANRSYKYAVSAYDNAGNVSGKTAEVIVNSGGVNTNAKLSITAPQDGSVVSGDVTAVANAASDANFSSVQFQVDGKDYKDAITAKPYSVTITMADLKEGSHTLSAVGLEGTDKTTAKAIKFTVDRTAPTISITSPKANAKLSGKNTLKISVKDSNMGNVQYVLDGHNIGAQITTSPYSLVNWDTVTTSSGTHSLAAIATDKAGNHTTSDAVSFTVQNSSACGDSQAPSVPAGLATGQLNPTTVELNWQAATDTGCSGLSGYTIYRDGAQVATTSDTSFTDSGLLPNTGHSYTVAAYDFAGNTSAQSGAISVTTPTTADSPPTIVFVSPEDNDTVRGTVTLLTQASDDIGITQVDFRQNNQLISTVTSAPYSVDWDTTQLANKTGKVAVTATVTDTTGHVTTATLHLTVDNSPPTLTVTAPKTGSKVSGKVKILATASDNANLTVQFLVDGKPFGLQTSKASKNAKTYEADWYPANFEAGDHLISVSATDVAGNVVNAPDITVTSDKQTCNDTTAPPAPANLKAKSNTTNSVNLSWDKVQDSKAKTNCAKLEGYALYRDDSLIAVIKANNYVDRGLMIATGYRYSVAAFDKAGNMSGPSPVLAASTKLWPNAVVGDSDFDGHVDGRDMSIILSNFKKNHDKRGDVNHDGQVDGADASVVLTNFGK